VVGHVETWSGPCCTPGVAGEGPRRLPEECGETLAAILLAQRLDRIFDEHCYFRNPCGALLSGASRDRRIHAPNDAVDAAQTEHTRLPERFKRIAESIRVALPTRIEAVGRVGLDPGLRTGPPGSRRRVGR
jgi:hypothetical protein